MYKHALYTLRTLSNLHAGSGDTQFGIIDKEVQRDTATHYPIINASSLKGAIKDHFAEYLADTNETQGDVDAVKPFHYRAIFGLDLAEQEQIEKIDTPYKDFAAKYTKLPKQGLIKFLDARLLFLPVPGRKHAYYHLTSYETLSEYSALLKKLGIDLNLHFKLVTSHTVGHHIYDKNANSDDIIGGEAFNHLPEEVYAANEQGFNELKRLFGIKHLAVTTQEHFDELLDNLPVIARNKVATFDDLDGNLWYEEVVPREAIFGVVLSYYDNFDNSFAHGKNDQDRFVKAFEAFEAKLLNDTIQIGANASIGYGLSDFAAIVPYTQPKETDPEERTTDAGGEQ
jgi:CRISPR-associated protein Cmr4